MEIQLNDISDKVLRKAGEALYLAQRLEHSLITHLLVREKLSAKVISTAMVHAIEAKVRGDRTTLGRLIRKLDEKMGVAPYESSFTQVLRFRNILAHEFWHKYRHDAGVVTVNRRMLVDLEIIIIKFKSEIDVIQAWTSGLALTHRLDISTIEADYEKALTFDTEYTRPIELVPRPQR